MYPITVLTGNPFQGLLVFQNSKALRALKILGCADSDSPSDSVKSKIQMVVLFGVLKTQDSGHQRRLNFWLEVENVLNLLGIWHQETYNLQKW